MPYLHFGNRQTLICMHVVYQLKKALEWKKSVQAGQCSRAPTRCTNWPPPPLSLFPYILLIPFFLSLLLVFTSLIFDPSASCPFSALAIAFFLSVGLDPFVCMFSTLKPNNRDCFSCFLGRSCRSFLQYTFLAASCFSLSVLMSKMHVYFLPLQVQKKKKVGLVCRQETSFFLSFLLECTSNGAGDRLRMQQNTKEKSSKQELRCVDMSINVHPPLPSVL